MNTLLQWSGRQPPDCIDAPPPQALLKHVLNQVYNRAVTNPEALNSYEPFSPEVYGETSFELINEIVKHTQLTENDVFVDLGSGELLSIAGWCGGVNRIGLVTFKHSLFPLSSSYLIISQVQRACISCHTYHCIEVVFLISDYNT